MERPNEPFYTQLKSEVSNDSLMIRKPFFCDVLVTEKCNLHCKKCFFWKNGIGDGLEIEEYKRFIVSLKEIVKLPFEINLGGGEPLLKKGIIELIKFCVQQGLQPAISTNATLIDERMAKELAGSGLHRISISLESPNEEIHDYITGTAGAWRRLMQGTDCLKKSWRKGDINIHTVISSKNMESIPELVEWVNRDNFFTGIAFQALAQPFRTDLKNNWYLDPELGELWPEDSARVAEMIDLLIARKRNGYRILNPESQLEIYKKYYLDPGSFVRAHRCNFGKYIFNVNVLGLVHLCCFMQPIGNIKNQDIKELWYGQVAKDTRAKMLNCQKSCNNIVNCYFQEEESEA